MSPFWVSDNNAGVATLYDGTGALIPLVMDIPSPTDRTHGGNAGAPTGQVTNLTLFTTPAFFIPNSQSATPPNFGPALFIFATEDGTIEAWNAAPFVSHGLPEPDGSPGVTDDALIVVDNSAAGAVYKGLALATRTIATMANVPFLYATNFRTGNVDVFDSNFNQVAVPGTFIDPNVQHGYAPFGIQAINNQLWVTYAQQDAAKHDPVNKPAHGFVSVFDTDGNLLSHFAQHGHLSSPWGVALAPASFGQFADDILVGNFGNDQINAYDPATGHWLGMFGCPWQSDHQSGAVVGDVQRREGRNRNGRCSGYAVHHGGLVGSDPRERLFAKISPTP